MIIIYLIYLFKMIVKYVAFDYDYYICTFMDVFRTSKI